MFDETSVQGDVLRPRLGRRALSGARAARSPRAGTRSRRTATAIGSSTTRRRARSATTCGAPRRCSRITAAGRCSGYRAPSYSITPRSLWALDILIEEGYRYDASIFPIRHDRYGIPVSPRHPYLLERPTGALIEAPGRRRALGPLNLPIGRRRILPHPAVRVDAWGIAAVNRVERRPAIFYLHPWEIDPDQPRLQAGALSRFRHYRNLDQTEARLRRLLNDFKFGPMSAVLERAVAQSRDSGPALALPYLW